MGQAVLEWTSLVLRFVGCLEVRSCLLVGINPWPSFGNKNELKPFFLWLRNFHIELLLKSSGKFFVSSFLFQLGSMFQNFSFFFFVTEFSTLDAAILLCHTHDFTTKQTTYLKVENCGLKTIRTSPVGQGTLKEEVSLYCWPPVWLVWNQLYDNWQFSMLFAKQTNLNRSNWRSTVQWYFPL
jgi:hypothetical protein